ncbi:hypothetical protein KUTeg_008646, partial [Tegillarca granosa]
MHVVVVLLQSSLTNLKMDSSSFRRKVVHVSLDTDVNQQKLFATLDHFDLRKTPDDGTFEPVSFQVPLKHPTAFTMLQNNKYLTQPKFLYSICHCLPEQNHYYGTVAPEGTIDIKEHPVLKKSKVKDKEH